MRTTEGQEIPLYDASHALLIGVSDYLYWPDGPGIDAELQQVEDALKARKFSVRRLMNPDSEGLVRAFDGFIKEYGFELFRDDLQDPGIAAGAPHITAYSARPVRQLITAGSAGEEVPASSFFVPYFVRALRGEADLDGDGYVIGTALGMYLRQRVMADNSGQTPQYGKIKDPTLNEGDYVFFTGSVPLGENELPSVPNDFTN